MSANSRANIFGESTEDAFDVSDEALDWQPVGLTDEPADEGGDEGEQSGDEGDEIEVVEGEDPDDNLELVEDPEPTTATDGESIPEQFRGKTAAELVKIIEDSQQFVNRQGNEIGELRKMVEAIQQQGQQPQPGEWVPASEFITTVEDGKRAYDENLQALDRGLVGVEAIDEIIDAVRDISPSAAARLDRDFGMRLARAEMQASMAPVVTQSRSQAERDATQSVIAKDPDATPYAQDVARIIQQPQSPEEHVLARAYADSRDGQQMEQVLLAAVRLARGSDPTKSGMYQQALVARKKNEAVEGGSADRQGQKRERTEDEEILASVGLLEGTKRRNPGDKLFENFAGG